MHSIAVIIIFLILLYSPPLTAAHHMVFEEICEMAGALSYIHAIVLVNISSLEQAIQNFQLLIANVQKGLQGTTYQLQDPEQRQTGHCSHQKSARLPACQQRSDHPE
jgi:hypothetical protein